jgi:hypothetical protein
MGSSFYFPFLNLIPYMKYFILLFLLNIPDLAFSQNGKLELGIDLLPAILPTIQGKEKILGFEIFVKSLLEKAELRLKIGYSKDPIHDSRLVNRATYKFDNDFDFVSYHNPNGYYFLNLGYAQKYNFKKTSFIYGMDIRLARYNGLSTIEKVHISGTTQVDFENLKSNYSSIGLLPFVGIKVNIVSNIFLNLEIGIIGNLVFGKYIFLNEGENEVELNFHRFESNWGVMTNDLSISYVF